MKQRIKNGKLIILALCAITAFFMGFVCLAGTNYARAVEEPVQTVNADAFEMIESAEVRTESPYGIRFKARVGANVKTAIENVSNTVDATNKGFLIFPKAYLANVTGENPDYKAQGVLTDYIDIPISNGTWYPEKDKSGDGTGYYLYNGVIHSIKEENRSLEFAAIAYYKDTTKNEFVYASFKKDFGRSITYILSKAYLNDYANVATLDGVFSEWFGTASNPIRISDANDMVAFSAAVQGGYNFNGKTVALANDITVDGVAPIRSGFTGTFDYNGKKLTVLNGGDGIVKCGTKKNETTDSVVSDKEYVYKATEGSAKNVFNEANLASSQGSKISGTFDNSNDKNSAKIVGLRPNASPTIELNYTKEELNRLKEAATYNQVTLQVKFVGNNISENSKIDNTNFYPSILRKAGVTGSISVDTWLTYTISLEDFISTIGITFTSSGKEFTLTDNQTLLSKVYSEPNTTFDVYVGNIVLSKLDESKLLVTSESNYNVVDVSGRTQTFVDNATLKTTFSNATSYAGGAVKIENMVNWALYLKLDLDSNQVLALGANDTYNAVKFRFGMVYTSTQDSGYCSANNNTSNINTDNPKALVNKTHGAGKIESGVWYEYTISLTDFVVAMGVGDTNEKTVYLMKPLANGSVDLASSEVYIGDMEVCYVVPTLFVARDSDESKNSLNTDANKTFVDNTSLKEVFTSGDINAYSGGAISLQRNHGQHVAVKVSLTVEEITALKNKFSHVQFSFGVLYDAEIFINGVGLFDNAAIVKVAGVNSFESGKWYTETVSIDEFIDAITAAKNVDSSYDQMVYLMRPSADIVVDSKYVQFTLYLGDIEFTNVSDSAE